MRKRAEFTLKTKLEALSRYARCPGVPEKGILCGKKFGSISDIHFDHRAREEITHDNSSNNCRPLCHECHKIKTFGTAATSAGSDIHMAAKSKRIIKKNSEPKRKSRLTSDKWKKKVNHSVVPRES